MHRNSLTLWQLVYTFHWAYFKVHASFLLHEFSPSLTPQPGPSHAPMLVLTNELMAMHHFEWQPCSSAETVNVTQTKQQPDGRAQSYRSACHLIKAPTSEFPLVAPLAGRGIRCGTLGSEIANASEHKHHLWGCMLSVYRNVLVRLLYSLSANP